MHRTLDDIRREGLDALRERLGRAGMIRFLQQFETGQGDYAVERRNWVDRTTFEEIRKSGETTKKPSKRRPPKRSRGR